jgi:hypothetical protein
LLKVHDFFKFYPRWFQGPVASRRSRYNGKEIFLKRAARTSGDPNSVQNLANAFLTAGTHRQLVKVFNGAGTHNFRSRLQDPRTGNPITEGIFPCLNPDPADCAPEPVPPEFRRGDADGTGVIGITDLIDILDHLFLGRFKPGCLDALDVNDSSEVDISDPLYGLFYLIIGPSAVLSPPPPGPGQCGPDPTADGDGDLGCENSLCR